MDTSDWSITYDLKVHAAFKRNENQISQAMICRELQLQHNSTILDIAIMFHIIKIPVEITVRMDRAEIEWLKSWLHLREEHLARKHLKIVKATQMIATYRYVYGSAHLRRRLGCRYCRMHSSRYHPIRALRTVDNTPDLIKWARFDLCIHSYFCEEADLRRVHYRSVLGHWDYNEVRYGDSSGMWIVNFGGLPEGGCIT